MDAEIKRSPLEQLRIRQAQQPRDEFWCEAAKSTRVPMKLRKAFDEAEAELKAAAQGEDAAKAVVREAGDSLVTGREDLSRLRPGTQVGILYWPNPTSKKHYRGLAKVAKNTRRTLHLSNGDVFGFDGRSKKDVLHIITTDPREIALCAAKLRHWRAQGLRAAAGRRAFFGREDVKLALLIAACDRDDLLLQVSLPALRNFVAAIRRGSPEVFPEISRGVETEIAKLR